MLVWQKIKQGDYKAVYTNGFFRISYYKYFVNPDIRWVLTYDYCGCSPKLIGKYPTEDAAKKAANAYANQ